VAAEVDRRCCGRIAVGAAVFAGLPGRFDGRPAGTIKGRGLFTADALPLKKRLDESQY
jgi:hypothetical protein